MEISACLPEEEALVNEQNVRVMRARMDYVKDETYSPTASMPPVYLVGSIAVRKKIKALYGRVQLGEISANETDVHWLSSKPRKGEVSVSTDWHTGDIPDGSEVGLYKRTPAGVEAHDADDSITLANLYSLVMRWILLARRGYADLLTPVVSLSRRSRRASADLSTTAALLFRRSSQCTIKDQGKLRGAFMYLHYWPDPMGLACEDKLRGYGIRGKDVYNTVKHRGA
jgi:hypothetical protein